MAATMGLRQVVLETDDTLVKMALDGDVLQASVLGGILTEIRLLLLCQSFLIALVCVLDCVIRLHADGFATFGCRVSTFQ